MVFIKAKLFWSQKAEGEKIECVLYDDNVEYYTFLRKCKSEGYRQVIVTTEIMTQVIRMAVIDKGFLVYKIEFAEEDHELEEEIQNLLRMVENNPAYFCDLLEKIKFLSEQSSIEIRRVYIKGKYNGKYAPNFFLQSNGMLGINTESFNELSKEISTLTERCLHG